MNPGELVLLRFPEADLAPRYDLAVAAESHPPTPDRMAARVMIYIDHPLHPLTAFTITPSPDP